MFSLKHALSIGMALGLAAFSLLAFWRAHSMSRRELVVLDGPLDSLAADWEAKKTPWGRRVVNLVLSDAGAGPDPFVYNPPRGGPL